MKKLCAIICLILLLCCVSGIALAEGGTEQPEPAPSASAVEVFRTAEDFAGMYLDEAQQFVVCIVNLNAAREAELKALVPDGKVIFKSAKYSYAELKKLQEEIAQDKNAPLTVPNALGIGLDERNNVIEITVNIADEAAAKAYYLQKYGDRVSLNTTNATAYLPQTDGVTPPQTGGAPSYFAAVLLLGAACAALAGKREA
ncbi:MAG: hypothetical protein DBX63_11565 [Clostridia bacterium]|nr:MAG: hypothetical protein DBX63_11565 [Clostridia bacterium]